jgi:hypothetical protein
MAYWHKLHLDGWHCPDCGILQYGEFYCDACVQRPAVLVTLPGRRLVVDFDGTEAEAVAMVERHYPDAVNAVLVGRK